MTELFTRSPANPLLSAANWPYPVNAVFNPGATRVGDETLLLCRVEDRRGISHLTVARSADGVTNWHIDPQPLISDDPDDAACEWGVEDPRITRIDELDAWLIAYTSYGPDGPCVSLATTTDFISVKKLGVIMPPEDKNACLLPHRIDGHHVLYHRPLSTSAHTSRADIWMSRSVDLHSWCDPEPVLTSRTGPWWDAQRIGMGPPPIKTEAGWLAVYHGVKQMVTGPIYRVGLALLDLDNPAQVLRRSAEWVFGPREPYEVTGDAHTVVFPTGLIHDPVSDELRLYYGAADKCIALATASLSDVLDHLSRRSADLFLRA